MKIAPIFGYNLAAPYGSNPNPLMNNQLEQWYQCNVWSSTIDKIFGNLKGVTCFRGESSSLTSSRTDMILRKSGNGVNLECGGAETASKYDDTKWNLSKMENIEIVGYIHSGLVAEFLILDHMAGYTPTLSTPPRPKRRRKEAKSDPYISD
ncbi:unnamed protein product [Cunninghamella blakesleeana]